MKSNALTKRDITKLQKIFERAFTQGFDHKFNIIKIYKLLRETAENEFTEDNKPTLDAFLKECFDEN